MKKHLWIPLVIASLLSIGCHQSKARMAPVAHSTPNAVLTVTAEPASAQTLQGTLQVTGSVAAREQLSLGAEVNGLKIVAVHAEEGDMVSAGQVLAELNSSVLSAQLEQQRARLRASQAAASKAVQPNRPQDLASLEAAVRQARANVATEEANLLQAQANLDNAQANLTRYQGLYSQDAVSRQEFENRQTEADRNRALVEAAQERVRGARFAAEQAEQRLSLAQAGGRSEDVSIAQANVDEVRAVIAQLEAQLAQTVVRAPEDGWVLERNAHVGDIASPNTVLFRLARDNQLELRAQVAQADLHRVDRGSEVTVRLDSGKTVTGTVREVEPMLDAATRLATVRIDLPAGSGARPGMFLGGSLETGTRQALTVPSSAVTSTDDGSFVMVYRDGTAEKREVTLGTRVGDLVEIASGLVAGEHVITSGAAFLSDGDKVALAPQ